LIKLPFDSRKTSLELAKVFELRQRRSSKGHDEDEYDGTELSEIVSTNNLAILSLNIL